MASCVTGWSFTPGVIARGLDRLGVREPIGERPGRSRGDVV